MIAEDHGESKISSKKVYDCIREKLLSASGDHILPIIYVIDSILKNVKGSYINLMEEDGKQWIPIVYKQLSDETRKGKLKRVWNTWKDFNIFDIEKWNEMGECFNNNNNENNGSNNSPKSSTTSNSVMGIPRAVCFVFVQCLFVSCSLFCFVLFLFQLTFEPLTSYTLFNFVSDNL